MPWVHKGTYLFNWGIRLTDPSFSVVRPASLFFACAHSQKRLLCRHQVIIWDGGRGCGEAPQLPRELSGVAATEPWRSDARTAIRKPRCLNSMLHDSADSTAAPLTQSVLLCPSAASITLYTSLPPGLFFFLFSCLL